MGVVWRSCADHARVSATRRSTVHDSSQGSAGTVQRTVCPSLFHVYLRPADRHPSPSRPSPMRWTSASWRAVPWCPRGNVDGVTRIERPAGAAPPTDAAARRSQCSWQPAPNPARPDRTPVDNDEGERTNHHDDSLPTLSPLLTTATLRRHPARVSADAGGNPGRAPPGGPQECSCGLSAPKDLDLIIAARS
jgi:hypothetical protein